MKHLLLAFLSAVLIGCAAPPAADNQQAANAEPGTRCERQRTTGTLMVSVRCQSAEQQQQNRDGVDALHEATRPTKAPGEF
ncbi:hypothetical protein [Pelomonas cellulosilytica]|uniref:Lipoprotein n=1 Tax=Pelomonas cellulosilytica TaxID=2906762 RepID=A0ABS8Y0I7_9BURK|nr:hypothetical protein [Pelomonas sp. P8]MCE4557103.1 hypothetical protein [Pelomonas sp. P8]